MLSPNGKLPLAIELLLQVAGDGLATGFKMGLGEVGRVAPLPTRALFRLHKGQGSRELLGQKADGNDMEAFLSKGLEVVGDAHDDGIDDGQPSLLLDLPNRSGLEGLAGLKVASWD